ncbi:WXG100 family type VII secretion target [Nocardioides sp. P5_E3]
MAGRAFAIDTDDLDAVISDVQATENALEALTNDIEKQIAALQSTWEGLAAEAQAEAHKTWEEGMRGMRAALADLRASARNAHTNYTGAADANVKMWESFS